MAVEERRKQADRSQEMRARLVGAAIDSLIEQGHARTTAVEVCRRAGVTRGALHHHFKDLSALLAAAMSDTYDRLFTPQDDRSIQDLGDWIDSVWGNLQKREFKAVIEVWLASRNQPELAAGLRDAMEKYSRIFSIEHNEALRRRLGDSEETRGFYRLAIEAMIGLALGRAITPDGKALAHEDMVIAQLRRLARECLGGSRTARS